MPDPRPTSRPAPSPGAASPDETCDFCGSANTWWRSCKLLCRQCGQIVKSCADL
jgi:hypothetical protein